MKAKTKLIILISVLSVCIVAVATGVTVAYWMGVDGSNVVAPQVDSADWNPWAKYVIYEAIYSNGDLAGFEAVGCTGILENVIIPQYATGGWQRNNDGSLTRIEGSGPRYAVTKVRNTLFAETTDKAIPVTLTIPTTVDVEPHTFAGLVNLTKITIKIYQQSDDYWMTIGQLAFLNCPNVKEFVVNNKSIVLEVPGVSVGSSFDAFKNATGLFVDELTITYA